MTASLAANDRIKVRMSALQAATQRACLPDDAAPDLEAECRVAGIAPAAIATLIDGAHLVADGRIAAPNLARLMKDIVDDAATMIRAVKAGTPPEGEAANLRLSAVAPGDTITASVTVREKNNDKRIEAQPQARKLTASKSSPA